MLVRALRYFSDNCVPGDLHPECPYSMPTPSGLGCANECLDYLGEHQADEAPSTRAVIGPGLAVEMIRRPSRARQGPDPARPAYDCGQLRIEEGALPTARQSPSTLLLRLTDLLTDPLSSTSTEERDRLDALDELVAELDKRGFEVEAIIREVIVPLLARMISGWVAMAIAAGDALPEQLTAYKRTPWTTLLLDSTESPEDAVRAARTTPETITVAIQRLFSPEGIGRIVAWMRSATLADLVRWRTPTPDELRDLPVAGSESTSSVQMWVHERFTSTYLENWSTTSLYHEWQYLHGHRPAPCSPNQQALRRIDKNQLSVVIAERATADDRTRGGDNYVVSKYVGVAIDLLNKGERTAAFNVFDMACNFSPQSADAHNNRGFCCLPDDPGQALEDFETARELGPSDPLTTAGNQVLALHMLDRNASALKVATDAWALDDSRSQGTMWDFRVDEPTLVSTDTRLYLADLASEVARRSGDASSAAEWQVRVDRRKETLEGK